MFLDKIIAELGLSRSVVSLLYMLGTLTGSFSLPFIGRFIDRKGPRTAVAAIASLFALACVGMGLVQGLVTLGLGFIAIRGLGQGSLGLVSTNVINLWFVRRRSISGLATTIAVAGTAFGPVLFALGFEQFGSYAPVLGLAIVVPFAIALTALWVEIAQKTSSAA
ncbi:MFS transporter [Coleofasciculus sp.]|uniref:MFS transporter n=1 Tax=Coleofasciculus sp. TaxID=3100458 RepID=UPI0039F799D2